MNSFSYNQATYNQMKGAQIAQTLSRTLTPSTLDRASRELQSMRGSKGFTVELLVVSDSADYPPAVRQSAVIYLKNAVQDHCSRQSFIPPDDLTDLKANLLEAIIRNVTNHQLAPTLREVVFQMAQKYYPQQWPQIVEEALSRLNSATEFNEILGCVEALRAVFLVFGGSVMRDIELGNLCNRAVLPLLSLASRLFQSFSPETSVVLLSVLKLFSAAIQFHMPAIIAINIHNLMIFVKKVLDLSVVLDDSHTALYHLKKTCLRILFRLYQRHANLKITQDKSFAQHFHSKYTRSFVETLVYQVLAEGGKEKATRHRHMELMRMSLSCLAYINRQNADAAVILMQHRESLIGLCLQRLRLNFGRSYQSFVDFRMRVQESRVQLKEFFFSLMQCQAVPDQQSSAVAALLGLLLNWLQNGDGELKELALYIYAEMSAELHFLKTSVEENMTLLIVNYVRPLLGGDQPVLVRMRACHLLASYNYLDLPEEVLIELATSVYNCLLVGGGEKESYLRIYACNAFNGLLKYPSIVDFVRPHLQDILRIYTSLLEADVSIIKNFEDLLNLLEQEIAPFANDLVLLLVGLFANYARQDGQASQFSQDNAGEESDNDDEESLCEEDDSNNESIAKACISSIRQILQAEGAQLSGKVREELLGVVMGVFADRSQLFIEEGYNILNLLLYKLQGPPEDTHYLFFKTITYAILGLPPHLLQQLQRGSNFQRQYADILENICLQPDNDLLENSIGCLRNFIAKSPPQVLHGYRDESGTPFIEALFRIVQQVHENEGGRHSQTDRLIVLTIYVTLVEYHVLEEKELERVVSQVLGWMQMEQEAVGQGGQSSSAKFVYSAVYLQIVLLAIHSYGRTVVNQLNLSSLLQRLLELQANFKCDYELARVLIGVGDLLQLQAISDHSAATALMQILPELVCRACRLRQEGDNPQNDIDMDDQAEEEDRLLGCDENSMMLGWQQKGPSQKDLQLQEDSEEDNDWEEEFNKFYDSPLDKIDEIKWLENALKGEGSPYCALLSTQQQEQLSLYFNNAPPKQ